MKGVALNGRTENDPEAEILDYSLVKARTKSLSVAYLLCITLGIFGMHHFYLRRLGFGFTYLCTGGLCLTGWIIDMFRLPSLVRATNDKIVRSNRDNIDLTLLENEKLLSDAYVMYLPPFGLLGFHHIYLQRFSFGCLYFFTLGLFGVGWFLDFFRMSYLVARANKSLKFSKHKDEDGYDVKHSAALTDLDENISAKPEPAAHAGRKRLDDAIVLCYGPFGLLGFHQFYLGNLLLGFLYIITLANFGICWIADMIKIRQLVQQTNCKIDGKPESQRKSTLQAYLLWIPPLGFLGAHHFYLDRPCSGLLHSATLGLFLVGWITDLFRIPALVQKCNLKQELQEYITEIEMEMSHESDSAKEPRRDDPEMVNPFSHFCCS